MSPFRSCCIYVDYICYLELTLFALTTLAVSWVIASQALREGAAKLRKQGHIEKKKEEKLTGGLVVKSIKLPIERVRDMPHYSDDAKYCNEFEPPRPRKKSKRASVKYHTEV